MDKLYFGLMCMMESIILLLVTITLTALSFEPVKLFFGVTTLWEEVAVGAFTLFGILFSVAAVIAAVKVWMEKKNESKTSE